jgi:hypothetical protein
VGFIRCSEGSDSGTIKYAIIVGGAPRNNLAPRPLWEGGTAALSQCSPREFAVEQFIHRQNLEHYRRLLAAPDQKDDVRRQTILKLLADEISKDAIPRIGT